MQTTPLTPEDLSVLLVFPPQGHPTQPYLALPSLKAWLAQEGFPGATVWDLNLEAYDHLVSNERLALALERITTAARDWGADERDVLAPEDLDRWRMYADALASGPWLVSHVDAAKDTIRDTDGFHDRERYLQAMRSFEAGLKLISTEFHPSLFTAHNYTQSTSIDSSADLFAGVDHPTENMFREFYEQHALPRIERELPDVLGISVTYGSQLVPALTLATLVKQRWPGIHITLGGGMLAYVGQRLGQAAPLFDRCDSIVVYEGERPLLELCRAVAAAGGVERDAGTAGLCHARGTPDLSGVSNILWRDATGKVCTNGELTPLPIDELPCPDFTDLPLKRYFSGEVVLPIAPARGCYYEKCGFCTLYTAIGPTFRERSVSRLVEDLTTLVARHGTPYFYFIMDDIPPLMTKRIPDAFREAKLEVFWWCDARMEERIFQPESLRALYEAGCRKLMFGFESGSQRVLDLVEKGTDLEQASRVVRWAHEAGISATLYTMVGLPTETREEARATRDFIRDHADVLGEISLQIFNLDMVSPMYRDPMRYGIARILDDPRDLAPGTAPRADLARYLECESVSGMTRAEVKAAFDEILAVATEELPALRGDNFLFYRYKSHIFLYLCRKGRDTFRHEHTAPAATQDSNRTEGLPAHVTLRDDLVLAPAAFPYADVRRQLARVWSDPTPLGGCSRSENHASKDARPIRRVEGFLGFLGRGHRFFELGRDTARLLEDATIHGPEAVLAALPEAQRTGAEQVLRSALLQRLLLPV